jgi:hypothetical protein
MTENGSLLFGRHERSRDDNLVTCLNRRIKAT